MSERAIRRSGRIEREVPIIVSGTDANSEAFSEKTRTILISSHGAKIKVRHQPVAGEPLIICWAEKQKEAPARIAWQRPLIDGSCECGVEFLDSDLNFWEADFPTVGNRQGVAASFLLECSRCHTQRVFDLDSFEETNLRLNQGLMRPCPRCQNFVIWNIPAM
jgi:PilZ domain